MNMPKWSKGLLVLAAITVGIGSAVQPASAMGLGLGLGARLLGGALGRGDRYGDSGFVSPVNYNYGYGGGLVTPVDYGNGITTVGLSGLGCGQFISRPEPEEFFVH